MAHPESEKERDIKKHHRYRSDHQLLAAKQAIKDATIKKGNKTTYRFGANCRQPGWGFAVMPPFTPHSRCL